MPAEFKAEIESFLNLEIYNHIMRSYIDFDEGHSQDAYLACRKLRLTDPELEKLNAALTACYMIRGKNCMWDRKHFQSYPANKCRNQIKRTETFVYCNLLIRFVHF